MWPSSWPSSWPSTWPSALPSEAGDRTNEQGTFEETDWWLEPEQPRDPPSDTAPSDTEERPLSTVPPRASEERVPEREDPPIPTTTRATGPEEESEGDTQNTRPKKEKKDKEKDKEKEKDKKKPKGKEKEKDKEKESAEKRPPQTTTSNIRQNDGSFQTTGKIPGGGKPHTTNTKTLFTNSKV